jgi:4'-phosphopantetheinyl transferase EntD
VIEQLLPACVAAVEVCHDELDVELFPDEAALVGSAVEKRRREFTTARACARVALGRIGIPVLPILAGERGEPLWPQDVVGSITHCEGYRACAVAQSSEILTIGIDAEPNAALPEGLLADIARPEELPELRALASEHADVHWERLLFSAKESVYKAWFPLVERWLGFEDARIAFDPSAGVFTARLLVPAPVIAGRPLSGFSGRWMVQDGLIVTAIAVGAG